MRKFVMLAALAALSGCSPAPRITAQTPAMVVVRGGEDPAPSVPIAEAACQERGRNAVMRREAEFNRFVIDRTFECVAP